MKSLLLCLIAALGVFPTFLPACTLNNNNNNPLIASTAPPNAAPTKSLRAFGSEREMTDFFRKLAEEQKKSMRARRDSQAKEYAAAAPSASAVADSDSASQPAEKNEQESVTNVQHAGVDEGGIVKVHGDHLVVLRRGRLFTVAIGDDDLKPVAALDAFGPEIDPRNAWYDEMLISDDRIAVIGYSYERGGTEIGTFQIDRAGGLRYLSTYHLRSNDYYSSRNYASRLIGDKLIFYTPSYVSLADPLSSFPAMRRWHRGARKDEFQRIAAPTRVYRTTYDPNVDGGVALHTVTVCDLSRGDNLTCQATSVVGAPGRVFYVSPESVYVWTNEYNYHRGENERRESRATLYRMPLDGSAPSALRVSGSPVDQFSFLESADNHLNVLVRSQAIGDGMWGAEVAAGDVALLRVPVASFADGNEQAPTSSYKKLSKPAGYTFQNRFVGDYLLYGTGNGWGPPQANAAPLLFATRWADGNAPIEEVQLTHGVDRIEAVGKDAMIVGADDRDVHFTAVRLDERARAAGSYVRRDAAQGELRSHGFFYKPDGPETGVLGLPVRGGGRHGHEHLSENSASILFLRNESLNLSELGDLRASAEGSTNDGCRASCVDWYGNARPLFVRGRMFALMGYELVEGRIESNRLSELRRIDFSPRPSPITRR